MDLSRRTLLGAGLAAGTLTLAPSAPAVAATPRRSRLARWQGTAFTGSHQGTRATTGGLVLAQVAGSLSVRDAVQRVTIVEDRATWSSRLVATGFPASELIASWNAATPLGSAVRIRLRARSTAGRWSQWFTMGLWASSSAIRTSPTRTSINGQSDVVARVATDTLKAQPGVLLEAFQVQVDLLRARGTRVAPVLTQLAVVASTAPQATTPTSTPGAGRGHQVAVPAYSQMNHVGHYPQWNGGGEAWCSATSTAMVLDRWKAGASATETSWVRPRPHVDPQVEQVVRGVWDAGYGGTGNWPFNVAYASARGLQGFVTRLTSLAEAERFVLAGIPLVVSTSFSRSQLTGAGFGTSGHLMVLRGFDAKGNVLVNDPASNLKASNALVPHTYDRAQFESAWGRSGGTCYVMYSRGTALPARSAGSAW